MTQDPLVETAVMDRDFILICKGLWQYFKTFYGGLELKRYAIERDKCGRLHRSVFLPMVKTVIMRRGEKLKPARYVVSNFRTTISDFKKKLKQDCKDAFKDLRVWLLDTQKMHVDEFIDSFNKGIADNLVHTFEFPGKILKDKFLVEPNIAHPFYIDEVIHHELIEKKTKELVLFVEAR